MTQGSKLNQETVNKILEMYVNKIPTIDIANKYNVSKATVCNYVKRTNTPLNKLGVLNQEHHIEILRLFNEGLSLRKIAAATKLDRNTVSNSLQKSGINIYNNLQRNVDYKNKDKQTYFTDLTDPDTQYWLGFLCADGAINDNKNSFGFTTKDLDLAEAFLNYLNLPLTYIYKFLDTRYNKYYYNICINNKKTVDVLKSYGITSRKTFSLKLTTPITFNMFTGIIDGDGHIRDSIYLCGAAPLFMNQVKEFIETNNFNCSFKQRGNMFNIRILKSQCDISNLINLMYSNLSFSLNRKKALALALSQ
jgi:predicted DNA-binding protein YlxM (UPF0122 family)